mmetsp:Transcript_40418/g.114456  ORF Transcript_40418/g.114456 Transcript_40418/m.114456 type:complete len:207 (+) Transcript_40418:970-1590(+)
MSCCRNVVFPTPMLPSTHSVRPWPSIWSSTPMSFFSCCSSSCCLHQPTMESAAFLRSEDTFLPPSPFCLETTSSCSCSRTSSEPEPDLSEYQFLRLERSGKPAEASSSAVFAPTLGMEVRSILDFLEASAATLDLCRAWPTPQGTWELPGRQKPRGSGEAGPAGRQLATGALPCGGAAASARAVRAENALRAAGRPKDMQAWRGWG